MNGKIRKERMRIRRLKARDRGTGYCFDKEVKRIDSKCRVTNKFIYLSEASCVIVIRAEGKYGRVAPYYCEHCSKFHMTSDPRTVKRFYAKKGVKKDAE
jgi:hypothetical protein